jgi:hypothetical protein
VTGRASNREGLHTVEAPIPVVARTCYREMNRGFAVPIVCDFAQEEYSVKDTKYLCKRKFLMER